MKKGKRRGWGAKFPRNEKGKGEAKMNFGGEKDMGDQMGKHANKRCFRPRSASSRGRREGCSTKTNSGSNLQSGGRRKRETSSKTKGKK